MNWKKRKIITLLTVVATIGTLYATVGPRHHHHHSCHQQQADDNSGNNDNSETPGKSEMLEK
jgi:hypothetical protein